MDKKILLIAGIFAVALVLFGCTQSAPAATSPAGDVNVDTAAIDAEINSSSASVDSSISDVPDVPDVNSGDLGAVSTQASNIVIDDASLAASIDSADAQVNSASDFSTIDSVSSPNLSTQ